MPADSGDGHALPDEVVAILREVLGASLLGAYLHGSAVLGGLRPTSDLDILAVVDRPMIPDQRRAVVSRLLEISGRSASRGPARPVELTVVERSQLVPWRYAPTVELMYGEWLRPELERGEIPEPGPMADLAPEVVLTLAGQRALFGPPPDQLMDPVPPADLRRAIVAGIPGSLADLESDTRNVLLTLARILATLYTRRDPAEGRCGRPGRQPASAGSRPGHARARPPHVPSGPER